MRMGSWQEQLLPSSSCSIYSFRDRFDRGQSAPGVNGTGPKGNGTGQAGGRNRMRRRTKVGARGTKTGNESRRTYIRHVHVAATAHESNRHPSFTHFTFQSHC
eukprot:765738-Hanusia_phi.AAC.5